MGLLNNKTKLNVIRFGIIFSWTFIIVLLFFYQVRSVKRISGKMALTEAVSKYNSDLQFRKWTTSHGGLYIPISENIEPNPFLSTIPEQNIESPSGKKLTLMNPAWAIRSINEFGEDLFIAKSHITSLIPLRPENGPDDWEKNTLYTFRTDTAEVVEISQINGEPYFRYMKPLMVEDGCLKCHGYQGYKVGDIRGGLSVSLPYNPFIESQNKNIEQSAWTLGVIYLVGLLLLTISFEVIRRRNFTISQTRDLLVNTNTALEKKIEDHEKAVVELKEAHDILNRSSTVVVLWKNDPTFTIDFISGNIYGLTGYSCEEMMRNRTQFGSVIHGEDRERVLNDFFKMIENNEESFIKPFRILCKDDSIKWLDCKGTFRRSKEGEIAYIEGIITDITKNVEIEKDRERLQSQLSSKNKMDGLGQFAGGIAHDFNNILHGISSSAELVRLHGKGRGDETMKYIDIIIQATARASDLTRQLLTYNQMDKISFETVNIHRIIDENLNMLRNSIDKKIDLTVEKNAVNSIVTGDASGLENALLNLIINAGQSIGGTGEIKIKTENVYYDQSICDSSIFDIIPGEFCEILVLDTGCGIPEDQLEKVLEPFYTTKAPGEGPGLGLTTVYSILKNHRGSLEIESTPGSGTSVKMSLPVVSGVLEHNNKNKTLISGSGRILFVDDEDINRILVPEMLESLGYEVLIAENGRDALGQYMADSERIDLVLMDMIMPVMDGKKAFIKLMEFDKKCKVIISSGYTRNENIDEMMVEGLCGFISKPYEYSEMSQMLDRLLQS